jgi:tetratricopeptide (TPR) repeat protein
VPRPSSAGLKSGLLQKAAQQQQPGARLQRVYRGREKALAEGRYDDAARAYEELRKADPTSGDLHARLGMIYFQQGKFAEAVPVLQRAVKLKPALSNAAALLAMCLSELGRYDEALPGLKTAFRQIQDPALKRMAGLHLMRANTFLDRPDRRGAGGARPVARIPEGSRGPLSHRAHLRESGLRADDDAGRRGAAVGVAAPGERRSQRE